MTGPPRGFIANGSLSGIESIAGTMAHLERARAHLSPAGGTGQPRPTRKSAETRARIVGGALRALEMHGLNDTTTRRIATEADVRLATLHYHFDSKEAVLLAVLDMLVSELAVTLEADTSTCTSLEARIAEVVRASWAYVERTRAKQIVQYELTLYALRTRGSEWLAARQYEGYVDAYATLLERGAASSAPTLTRAQARDLAHLILAGVDGLILQALAGAAEQHLKAGLDAVTAGAQARARMLVLQNRTTARARTHA